MEVHNLKHKYKEKIKAHFGGKESMYKNIYNKKYFNN